LSFISAKNQDLLILEGFSSSLGIRIKARNFPKTQQSNMANSDVKAVDALAQSYKDLKNEIAKVIVGQDAVVQTVIISLFSNGHSLLVGMGSEILGDDRKFKFNHGPLFSNIVLADEINRTPPKTQAALLEAMQERSVTVSGVRHLLPSPFFVLATQNPIEQEGTYPLPEAQLDRFMFNIPLDYPSYEEEVAVVKGTTTIQKTDLKHVLSGEQILAYQQLIRKIPIADNVLEYAVSLATKTRPNTERATQLVNDYISWGAGPRASQYLVLGAKCHAAINGKYSPDIEDVQAIANYVLRHRIVRNYKAEAEGITEEDVIKSLF